MKRRKNTLNEKIPPELAAAMKRAKNYAAAAGITTRYPQYDFENANYEEITADEARALRKQRRADEVIVLTRYGIARFYDDGTVSASTTGERNTFKSNIESPNLIKIYHTDEKQHRLDHRARQLDQKRNQLISYKSDGSSYSYDTDTVSGEEGQKMTRVIGDTGSHEEDSAIKNLSRWIELAENDVDNFKKRIESLNKDLEDLTKKFDDGDLSRNEFTRQQQKLLDQLDIFINDRLPRAQKELAEYKNDLANRKSEISTSRYTAQANLMSAPLKRLKYIKDNPAEKDILNAEEKIKDAKADDEAQIKRLEDKIASLQDEIKDLQTEGSWYSNHAKEELEDAKNRLAQQEIDKEKIKAGTFNEGVDRWDITITSGTKLRDLIRNAPEDFEDEYAFAEFAEKFVDAYDDCLDEIIRIGKDAEDLTLVEVFSDFKSDFHEDYLVAELDTDWVNFWLNEFYDLCDNFKVFINL